MSLTEPRIDDRKGLAALGEPDLSSRLDELAERVAAALDAGDDAGAWDIVAAVEDVAGPADDDRGRPSAPVIARRFARAHRRLLSGHRPAMGAGMLLVA